MNSDTTSTHTPSRFAFAPLKQKRRFRFETAEDAPQHQPVIVSAKMEIARQRQRERIPRSGRQAVQWRRVPSPIRVSEVITPPSRSPVLAKVIDKVKAFQPRNGHNQGIWSLLRCWALASR